MKTFSLSEHEFQNEPDGVQEIMGEIYREHDIRFSNYTIYDYIKRGNDEETNQR